MRLRSSEGFSLVELMVVVGIVAILVMAAMPNMLDWMQNSRTRSVAESLQNGLRLAQAEAARLSRSTIFVTNGTGWTVTFVPANASETVTTLQAAADGNVTNVTITPTAGAAAIQFNNLGRAKGSASAGGTFSDLGTISPADSSATFLVRSSTGTRKLNVTVSQGGKVRMCDPDQPLATNPVGCS